MRSKDSLPFDRNLLSMTFITYKMSLAVDVVVSRDETARSSISSGIASKILPNLPILRINHEFKGIMVNMGRIHREFRNFSM